MLVATSEHLEGLLAASLLFVHSCLTGPKPRILSGNSAKATISRLPSFNCGRISCISRSYCQIRSRSIFRLHQSEDIKWRNAEIYDARTGNNRSITPQSRLTGRPSAPFFEEWRSEMVIFFRNIKGLLCFFGSQGAVVRLHIRPYRSKAYGSFSDRFFHVAI